jgi:Ca2+-binding RTX toxin-like protein
VATYVSIPGSGKVDLTVYGRGTVIAGSGNDRIDITGQGQIIVGSGHDTLTLGAGGTIWEHGSSGKDTINLGKGDYTIYEQGKATVTGAFGSATISGGELQVVQGWGVTEEIAVSGKLTLQGGASQTEFVGGGGSTLMRGGGKGNDTFVGGSGHDTMIGGSGHNLFEFLKSQAGGQAVITNFVSGHDQLYLEGYSLSWLESHHDITTHGSNTWISLDGGKTTIELEGVKTLKPSDVTTHK